MNPKKLIVPTLCVLLGCAGGAALGSVTAQTFPEPATIRPMQQECIEPPSGIGRGRLDFVRDEVRIRGEHGWELVGEVLGTVCFKRPAQ